ncbi:hypothetical protein BV501_11670 [Erwinia sp. OAMSP11]|nr:hypothetical protein BV501_11670 [Erwinia sp. OAMSP11]
MVFFLSAGFVSLLACISYRFTTKENLVFTDLLSRSFCEHCGKQISALYVLPVFGYLLSKGRCGGCKTRISLKHLLIEAAAGLITVILYKEMKEQGVVVSLLIFLFLSISYIDIKMQIIPYIYTIPLIIGGFYFVPDQISYSHKIYGALCGFAMTLFSMALVSLIKKENVIAGGDILLITAAGAWLGINMIPLLLLFTALTFIAYALPYRLTGTCFTPMGPAICIGFSLCLFFQLMP